MTEHSFILLAGLVFGLGMLLMISQEMLFRNFEASRDRNPGFKAAAPEKTYRPKSYRPESLRKKDLAAAA